MAHSLVCQLASDQESSSSKDTIVFNSLDMISYYSPLSKTDQIMSRYRPIAPKPQLSIDHHHHNPPTVLQLDTTSTTPPQKPQRPRPNFVRNLSPHLQTRPPSSSRGCRKRTKVGFSPCNTKRSSSTIPLLLHAASSSSAPHAAAAAPSPSSTPAANALNQSMQQGFTRVLPQVAISPAGFDDGLPDKLTIASPTLVTPPLLPHLPTPAPAPAPALLTRSSPTANYYYYYSQSDDKVLDLNSPSTEFPQEEDVPEVLSCKIIAPLPVRPIGSSIHVVCINDNPSSSSFAMPIISGPKRPEEVEEEVECELLPAVVSDSNNRVRLANSAYKEMVGQPECPWLDSTNVAPGVGSGGGACKRIGGEVTLHLSDAAVPSASNGFSCKVIIGWRGSDGKNSIYAPCDVTRLSCVSKDYLFTWRFHITEAFAHTHA